MLLTWLDHVACQDSAISGGKAANLSRLAVAYPVPVGFCLTTNAYARWSSAVQQQAAGEALPAELVALLATAYATLAQRSQEATPAVAVRSSAVGEDGQNVSFAGQYETYLNIVGAAAVAEAVLRCWSSAQAERVQNYQERHGALTGTTNQPVAVLVQQLIVADCAFVAFSRNPLTGKGEELFINANWGLGESIVSGTATPDTYIVRKSDGVLLAQTIGDKQSMTVLGTGVKANGVQSVKVPRLLRQRASLNADQIRQVAQLATELEATMGWAVDIEGAFQGERLYLLQCRPVSTQ
ncbi:MAG: PEP/pyruvate-binding domain-containing protein [Caldilineaceae bacterium]